MRAIVHDSYGPPEILRVEELPRPVPGSGEVLVRIHAAGVDPGVWHLTTGKPYLVRALGFGLRAPKLRIRGLDLAGVVEAVGPGVSRFAPDDEVYGTCDGSYAEYATTSQDRLARKPAGLTFEQAAAVPVSGCTALQALRDSGRLQSGGRVLVLGASGGVGSFAVQLAKASGAHVTGVCSPGKADLVRALGADEVVDYTRDDPTDGPGRYDLVLDAGGNRTLGRLRRILAPGGTLVLVGGESGGNWTGGFDRQLRAVLLPPIGGRRVRAVAGKPNHDDLAALADLVEAGSVVPALDRSYGMDEAADAINDLMKGHVRGKAVIRIG
ncbi:NAD(P)-dependent alcohol dehydrogenase [Kitasatospora sp. MBT63]|uniref:NAD(P)-dependent alcohol dehydrogenase n=1 Tax=Kitasatospora sp. MBT63 TaxID=1444768 RepID=UPI00053B609F|nr:NAD(P)-dependent alcohol dehydrogenase [Kitasatospora sp. MBT63]